MYLENEVVERLSLPDDVKLSVATALGCAYEDIKFFFITYEEKDGHEYAVLSAETDTKFAIVNCPVEYLDNTYEEETEELITKMLMDWALDQYNATDNPAEKESWIDYMKELQAPKKESQQSPGRLKIGPVIDGEDDDYEDPIINDDELFFMPEDE